MRGKTKKNAPAKEEGFENLKGQLARALADYDNLQKRVEVEKEVWISYASERVIKRMLEILDMLQSAQVHLGDSGLAIAIGEFKKALQDEGAQEIHPQKEEEFNPEFHEATEVVEGGKKGAVAELVLPGWKFGEGRIIRAAKVKVFGDTIKKE